MYTARTAVTVATALLIVAAGTGCSSRSQTTSAPPAGAQPTVGQRVDDATITAQVKGRLATAEAETLTNVNVDTVNGVVYLNGTVDSSELKTRAESIARSQEGVQRVVNNLQVASR